MSQVTIRKALPKDASDIIRIQEDGWLVTYPNQHLGITRSAIQAYFVSKGSRKERVSKIEAKMSETQNDLNIHETVAESEGKVVGWCIAKVEAEDTGRLQAIYARSSLTGKGVGTSLMDEALVWLGRREILVNVISYNDPALRFYEKFGFEKTGKTGISLSEETNPARPKLPYIEMKLSPKEV